MDDDLGETTKYSSSVDLSTHLHINMQTTHLAIKNRGLSSEAEEKMPHRRNLIVHISIFFRPFQLHIRTTNERHVSFSTLFLHVVWSRMRRHVISGSAFQPALVIPLTN